MKEIFDIITGEYNTVSDDDWKELKYYTTPSGEQRYILKDLVEVIK